MIATALSWMLVGAGAAWTGYLTAIGSCGLLARLRRPAINATANASFLVVIPAHNERANIEEAIASVKQAFIASNTRGDILVIADNCEDDTALLAFRAGARVYNRRDDVRRGKGYALQDAVAAELRFSHWEWLVVMDADTIMAPDFFAALAPRIAAGARAIQAHYTGRAEERSWRTDLIQVAWSLFNYLRPLGRTALGCTAGIYGNGFALSRPAVEAFPFESHSVVEDAEHALELLVRGIRVEFEPQARVSGLVEASAGASESQRIRWESGRLRLAATWIPALLAQWFRTPRVALLEAAADIATPPLAVVVLTLLAGLLACAAAGAFAASAVAIGALLLLVMLVAGAPLAAGLGFRSILSLAHAPAYVFWKVGLYFSPKFWMQRGWVRTARSAKGVGQ